MKKALKIAAAAIAALVCACVLYLVIGNSLVNRHNQELKDAIISISGRKTVTLNEIVPFDWEAVYTFTPYTNKEQIEKIIGFQSAFIRETVSEGMVQLLFVKGKSVVASVCRYPGNLGYNVLFSGRIAYADEAVFTVEKTDGGEVLLRHQPSGGTLGTAK